MATFAEWVFSRSRIVVVCKIGTVLSLMTLIVAFLLPDSPFLLKLAAWFSFFLFAFHWFFGAAKSLTITHARFIDYVYLWIAAVGVFVFALNYEGKRYEYLQANVMDEAYASRGKHRMALIKSVVELERVSCDTTIVTLMSSYCEQAKELKNVTSFEYETLPLEAAVGKFLKAAPPPDLVDRERSDAYGPIAERIKSIEREVRWLKIDDLHIELQKPLEEDVREYAYGLFTWPFILAFAFALRITKTTIEVLEWTAPLPASAIVQPVEEPLPEIGPSPPTWINRERG